MELAYDFNATGKSLTRDMPTVATLAKGALVMAGITTGMSSVIVGAAPYINCLGVTDEVQASTGTISAGTQVYTKVIVSPGAVFSVQYHLTGNATYALACTGSSDTSQFTVSTSDNHFDGSYAYVLAGTGIGQLHYIATANTTTLDTLSTIATAADATSYIHMITGAFGPADGGTAAVGGNLDLDGTAVFAITDETATGQFGLFQKWIEIDGSNKNELRVARHDGLTGLNNKNVKFYIDVMPASHQFGRPTELS